MKPAAFLKTSACLSAVALSATAAAADKPNNNLQNLEMEKLSLTQKWDKVFPQSDKVKHSKITFVNRYGITLAADMYEPANASGKLPAIAVSGPFGAVKEQSSGLYAQTLAERGFLAIAFDPSYTGESGGSPRNVASPTSIPKTSAPRSISSRPAAKPTPIKSGFSEYAAVEEWQSTPPQSTRE